MDGSGSDLAQRLLEAPRDQAAYYGLCQVLRAARSASGADNPLLAGSGLRVALVTATDSKFLRFFRRLLGSVPPDLRRDRLDVCVLDVGLTEADAAALRSQGCKLAAPGWDIEFPGMDEVPVHLRALVARPFLPRHFPGYHVYIWIDADAWVQKASCLDDFVLAALTGAIAIAPVISPAYRNTLTLAAGEIISTVEWGRRSFHRYFEGRLSRARGDEPILNAGIFALRGDAPHWSGWADALRLALALRPGEFFAEQAALNFAVYEGGLERHLLPAGYNWQTHLSLPVYDPESGLLCEPHLPYRQIEIVHLTGPDKADPKTIRFLDGRSVRQSLLEPLPVAGPATMVAGAAAAGREALARAPATPGRGDGRGSLVTLPNLTRAAAARGRPLRVRTHEQNETLSRFLRIQGVWQRDVSIFIDSALGEGDVFVDLGANIGYFSVLAAAAAGASGRVHAFEPDPRNFELLEANKALNGLDNIVCHRVAIGEASGSALLYRSRTNWGAHSLIESEDLADPLEVRVQTLDDALADESAPVAMIKMDLQGAELPALRGMAELLERQAVKPMIILEYSVKSIAGQDPELAEFKAFVSRHGYQIHGFVTNTGQSRTPPRLDLAAFLAIHESFVRHGEAAELDLLLSPGTPEVKRR